MQARLLAPLQDPPHGAVPPPVHAPRAPCGWVPEVVSEQTPTLPETSQASHCPPHAELQHTLSTHEPEVQLELVAHAEPLTTFGTHAPALQ